MRRARRPAWQIANLRNLSRRAGAARLPDALSWPRKCWYFCDVPIDLAPSGSSKRRSFRLLISRTCTLITFFYLGPRAAPTGLVGCEIYGNDGLLRSLAVTHDNRGSGTGSALVEHVEAYARKQGVRVMYLLTTTAEEFFARRGYSPVDRNQVPDSIRSTSEYCDICPASSAIMVKHL